MTPETYVIGSVLLALIVVAFLSAGEPIDDAFVDASKCPRCGAEMQDVGSGVGGCVGISVVPRILVLSCPQCGYSERSWGVCK
jgi:predicted RNA-binding Zn-ribbon protein involved in translation (DUF1610 family)